MAENLLLVTGAAEYGKPEVQQVIEVHQPSESLGQIALRHRVPDQVCTNEELGAEDWGGGSRCQEKLSR